MMTGLILIGLLVAVSVSIAGLYNGLVKLRNASDSAWSDIDVQLKRRADLVPNLVESVKGYAGHERTTLDEVTQARAHALRAVTPGERSAAESALGHALGGLLAVAEAYPELKASENFLSLQGELSRLENAIQKARRYYNAVVRDLNTQCEAFPSNLVASRFGFAKKAYFELESPAERAVPAMSFP